MHAMNTLLRFAFLGLPFVVAGCSSGSDDHGTPADSGTDAYQGHDSGPGADSGPPADSAPGTDSGPIVDSGPVADGPETADGGSCGSELSTNPCNGTFCTSLPPTCPTSCTPLGSVQFHLNVPANDDAGVVQALTYMWASDAVNWFSVAAADGGALQIVPPTADNGPAELWAPSCSACASIGGLAPLQGGPSVGDAGVGGTWNGTDYSMTSTCNQGQNGAVPCGEVLCAPAGSYVVKMCVEPLNGTSAEQCVSVPFDFPGTPDVSGTIGQ
jgi:hypothetical protein